MPRGRSEPAAAAEHGQQAAEDRDHEGDDDPEGRADPAPGIAAAGKADVHPHDAREEGQREQDDADHGQDTEDVVDPVRDHGLVGDLERLDDLLVVLEHVPDALVRVDDVVEVDLEVHVGGEVALLDALEIAEHRTLRADHLAEVDDLLLHIGDIADDLAGASLEDLLLLAIELVADLAQHREAVVEAVVDQPVEQVPGAAAEELVAELLLLAAALEEVLDGLQRLVRDGDQEARSDEQVELAGPESPGGRIEDRELEDDEEVVVVDVDLRPLVP